jgi:predicted transcriptional regulator
LTLPKEGVLEKLQALAESPSAGPSPGFAYPHACGALLLIGDKRSMGRAQLSKTLGLGEGTARTIIRHFSRAGMVKTTRKGCALTSKGRTFHRQLRSRLSKMLAVDAKQLTLDHVSTALMVKGVAPKVRRGIEQRDAAVRAGATGACTILMKRGKFVMPSGSKEWRLSIDDPLAQELSSLFHPHNDDVIIIASANNRTIADYGAIAAALTLVG